MMLDFPILVLGLYIFIIVGILVLISYLEKGER